MGASVTVIVFSVIFVCVLCIIIFSLGLLAVLKTSGSCSPRPKTISPASKQTCNNKEVSPISIANVGSIDNRISPSINPILETNIGKFTLPPALFSEENRNVPLGTIEYVSSNSLSDRIKNATSGSKQKSTHTHTHTDECSLNEKIKINKSVTSKSYSSVDTRTPPGSYNGPIDVQSSEYDSDSDDEVEVSSPTVQRYMGPQFFTMGTSCKRVLDAVTFSTWNLWLETNNTIRVQDGNKNRKVTLNENIRQLCTFADDLYGLSTCGILYVIQSSKTNEWKCSKVSWTPDDIIFISSTYDDENIWIQTSNTGYLFDNNFRLLEEVTIKGKYRIYGMDKNHYAVYDYLNKVSSYEDCRVNNTKYCLLDSHNRLYVVQDDKHSKIVLIQWNPMYVEK